MEPINKNTILICLREIEAIFDQQRATLNKRSPQDQNILGAAITILESDIKNTLKKLITP